MYKAKLDDIYDNYVLVEKASGDDTTDESSAVDDRAGKQMKLEQEAFEKSQREIRELFCAIQAKDLIIKKLQRHISTDGEGESVEEIMASEAEAKEEFESKELAISHCLLSGQLGDAELLDTGCHLSSASLKKLFDITE